MSYGLHLKSQLLSTAKHITRYCQVSDSSLPFTMSDDEGDVHVCDICQEIFLGTDELEEHMKEDHAAKVVGF